MEFSTNEKFTIIEALKWLRDQEGKYYFAVNCHVDLDELINQIGEDGDE